MAWDARDGDLVVRAGAHHSRGAGRVAARARTPLAGRASRGAAGACARSGLEVRVPEEWIP
eukprot:8834682-Alexandrium_andersonii.AAC.1